MYERSISKKITDWTTKRNIFPFTIQTMYDMQGKCCKLSSTKKQIGVLNEMSVRF